MQKVKPTKKESSFSNLSLYFLLHECFPVLGLTIPFPVPTLHGKGCRGVDGNSCPRALAMVVIAVLMPCPKDDQTYYTTQMVVG